MNVEQYHFFPAKIIINNKIIYAYLLKLFTIYVQWDGLNAISNIMCI